MAQATDPNHPSLAGKYLTFYLAEEEYGVPILTVQEIIGVLAITAIPGTPKWVRGVINLRGKIISVIDLRMKLGLSPVVMDSRTCIVVVQAHGAEMGVIVDQVSEVVDLPREAIESAPNLGAHVRTEYLLGIGKTSTKVRLLLDIDRALSQAEMARARAAATSASSATEETQ